MPLPEFVGGFGDGEGEGAEFVSFRYNQAGVFGFHVDARNRFSFSYFFDDVRAPLPQPPLLLGVSFVGSA
jgi:hypothetical protein